MTLRQVNISFLWWLLASIGLGLVLAFPTPLSIVSLGIIAFGAMLTISPMVGLALMLILSPLRTLILTESAIQTPLDIGQITFAVFMFGWLMHRIANKQPILPRQLSSIQIPIIVFTTATSLTVFVAPSISTWLTEWLKWIIILVLTSVCMPLFRERKWQWAVALLCISGAANAIIGLYIFFGGSGADHLLINGRFFRAFGTFGQPNPFGGFMGLVLPLGVMMVYGYGMRVFLAWRRNLKVRRADLIYVILYGSGSLVMVVGLLASWSRGAWLSFIVSFAVVAFALPRLLWQSFMLVGFAGVLIASLWFSGLLPQSVVDRLVSSTADFFVFDDMRGVDITGENYAVVERLAHWQAALNMAQNHPWLGVGFGNYEVAYSQHQLLNWDEALGHAHNYYLNILGEAGIIGSLSYMGMWLAIAWFTWCTRQHPDVLARSVAVGLCGTWAYLMTHSLIDNLYVNNLFLHLGVMLGILACLYSEIDN